MQNTVRRGALSPCQKQVSRLVKRGTAVVRSGCTKSTEGEFTLGNPIEHKP